ncbi:transcription repressor OFP8 [Oryza glaberrima]|uniref:Transcription repressor n=1 Tax=Oryza glaberrima TaxID=4538 RepID=I1NTL9_ORYGL|nr:transcription repressor OFP8 [Oryza glaberrima]
MSGRSSRRGSFSLRQPPVVDIGCNCRRPKLFSIFSSSSSSSFRRGGSKPKSPNASSTSTTTAFTATTGGAGTATSTDSSWGPASFTTNSLFEEPAAAQQEQEQLETRRRRRQQRRRRRRAGTTSFARGGDVGGHDDEQQQLQEQAPYRRVAKESVAVAVESAEPYEDFRESMVQMVVEKEIYAWDDLNDLLHQFLSLNSPRHHPLILHAFADLWTRNGLFSPPSPCQF